MQQHEFLAILRHSAATRQRISRQLAAHHRHARYWALARQGFILIAAYLSVAVMSIMSLAYFNRISNDHQLAQRHGEHLKALHYVDGALDAALAQLSSDPDYTGTDGPVVLGIGAYDIAVDTHPTDATLLVVTATGYARDPDVYPAAASEQLEALVRAAAPSQFSWGFFGHTSVTVSGSAAFDAYDSSAGAYASSGNQGLDLSVATNSPAANAITVGSNFQFPNATLYCGAGTTNLTACINAHAHAVYAAEDILETAIDMTTPTLPSEIGYVAADLSLSGSTIYTLDVANPLVVDAGDYYVAVVEDLSVSGSARILVDLPKDLHLYVTGNVSISGSAQVGDLTSHDATKLQLFATATSCTVGLNGSAQMAMGIYAPRCTGMGNGSATLYGALLANTLTISGSFRARYDAAFGPAGDSGSGAAELVLWHRPSSE